MYGKFEKLLKERGISAYKCSKETGISQATLSDWKRGVYTPKSDKLQKLSEYFGVSIDYFYETEDQSYVVKTTPAAVNSPDMILSELERELIIAFRKSEHREAILALLQIKEKSIESKAM